MATPPINPPPATVWQAFISDVDQGEDDPETLIAYSIYKSDIFATYNQGQIDGKSPAQITAEINAIKSFVRTNFSFRNTFRQRAATFSSNLESAVHKKITSDLWNKIEQQNVQRVGLFKKFLSGLWDGLMSIVATAVMVIIITGTLSLFVSPETRMKLAIAGLKSAASTLNGGVTIVDYLTEDKPPSNKEPKPQ